VSADHLRVSAEDVAATAQTADNTADQMFERYHGLAREMISLLDDHWSGSGADACRSAWSIWSSGFELVLRGLRDEVEALALASSEYPSADAGGAATINQAAQAL